MNLRDVSLSLSSSIILPATVEESKKFHKSNSPQRCRFASHYYLTKLLEHSVSPSLQIGMKSDEKKWSKTGNYQPPIFTEISDTERNIKNTHWNLNIWARTGHWQSSCRKRDFSTRYYLWSRNRTMIPKGIYSVFWISPSEWAERHMETVSGDLLKV